MIKWILIVWTAYTPNADVSWTTMEFNSEVSCNVVRERLLEKWAALEDGNFSYGIGECYHETK